MVIFAIDPGNIESGYAIVEMPECKIIESGKVENEILLEKLFPFRDAECLAIEMIASYGMPVGKDVFETCLWIGRFTQVAIEQGVQPDYIYRREEKLCLCGSPKAKDANVKQALIDRYAKHDYKSGKGIKKNPDTFYGVSKDAWQAIAVAVTRFEKEEYE